MNIGVGNTDLSQFCKFP